jgi:hypothetical protein
MKGGCYVSGGGAFSEASHSAGTAAQIKQDFQDQCLSVILGGLLKHACGQNPGVIPLLTFSLQQETVSLMGMTARMGEVFSEKQVIKILIKDHRLFDKHALMVFENKIALYLKPIIERATLGDIFYPQRLGVKWPNLIRAIRSFLLRKYAFVDRSVGLKRYIEANGPLKEVMIAYFSHENANHNTWLYHLLHAPMPTEADNGNLATWGPKEIFDQTLLGFAPTAEFSSVKTNNSFRCFFSGYVPSPLWVKCIRMRDRITSMTCDSLPASEVSGYFQQMQRDSFAVLEDYLGVVGVGSPVPAEDTVILRAYILATFSPGGLDAFVPYAIPMLNDAFPWRDCSGLLAETPLDLYKISGREVLTMTEKEAFGQVHKIFRELWQDTIIPKLLESDRKIMRVSLHQDTAMSRSVGNEWQRWSASLNLSGSTRHQGLFIQPQCADADAEARGESRMPFGPPGK